MAGKGWHHTEETKKKLSENMSKRMREASHTWYTRKKGSKYTAREFADAYNRLVENRMKYAKTEPPKGMPPKKFYAWVRKFESEGMLRADRFTDGKAVYLNWVPIFKGAWGKRKKAELRNRKDS